MYTMLPRVVCCDCNCPDGSEGLPRFTVSVRPVFEYSACFVFPSWRPLVWADCDLTSSVLYGGCWAPGGRGPGQGLVSQPWSPGWACRERVTSKGYPPAFSQNKYSKIAMVFAVCLLCVGVWVCARARVCVCWFMRTNVHAFWAFCPQNVPCDPRNQARVRDKQR